MTARFASGRIPCIWATLMLSELVACGSKSPETTSSPDGGGSKEEKDGGTKTSSDATHADASHADASLTDATSTEAAAPVVGTHVASCDETVVQDAINNAKSGDTLLVPAGQCTWTTGVTLPNSTGAAVPDSFAISLKGAGASSSGTVITYGGTGVTLLNVNPPYMYNIKYPATLGHYDISGFYMTGGDPAYYSGNHMAISGPTGWKNVRVHDMLFEGGTQASIVATASVAGLVDHCTFQGDMGAFKFYGQGEADWTTPLVLGTADFFFVEDNTFNFADDMGNLGRIIFDLYNGGRVVVRHNSAKYGFFETHDMTRSGLPSGNAWEVYDNTLWSDTWKWEGFTMASGTGVIFGNTITGPYQHPIGGLDYKSDPSLVAQYLNYMTQMPNVLVCDGNDPADQDVPVACQLTPSLATSNGFTACPSGQQVSSPLTALPSGVMASTMAGWRCQYQMGTQGMGAAATSYPIYVWDNTIAPVTTVSCATGCSYIDSLNGTGLNGLFITDGAQHVVENRDFFNDTKRPGYTPFTYPHPLAAAGP